MNKLCNEIRLGRSRDKEILIGSLLGALLALPAIAFVTGRLFA